MKTVRPSSLKYIEICSDFEQPEQTEVHAMTEAGTRLHYAMETGDITNIEDEELHLYEAACQARADLMNDVFGDYEATVYKELSFEVDGEYAGTTDHVAVHANVGLMIDYKFGRNSVDAPDTNIQFQDYVVKTFDKFRDLNTLVVAMIAPRRDEVMQHTYKRSDVPELRTRTAMVRARVGTGQRKASPNCQYCSHLGSCGEAYKTFASAKHQDDMLPTLRPDLDLTKPLDLVQVLELKPVIKAFVDNLTKAADEAAKELLSQGYEVGDFYLQQRKRRSVVSDADKLKQEAMALGLSEQEWAECTEVSLTKVVNYVRDKAPYRKKKVYEDALKSNCADAIEQGDTYEVIAKRK